MSNMLKTATQYKKNTWPSNYSYSLVTKRQELQNSTAIFIFCHLSLGCRLIVWARWTTQITEQLAITVGAWSLRQSLYHASCSHHSLHIFICAMRPLASSAWKQIFTWVNTRPPHNGSAFCSLRINWCLLNKVVSSAVGELWWIERFGEQQGLQVVLTSAVVQRKLLLITDWIELSGAEEWHWCSLTIHDNVLLLSTTTSATSTFPGLWITLNRILVNFACLCFKRKKLFN